MELEGRAFPSEARLEYGERIASDVGVCLRFHRLREWGSVGCFVVGAFRVGGGGGGIDAPAGIEFERGRRSSSTSSSTLGVFGHEEMLDCVIIGLLLFVCVRVCVGRSQVVLTSF